jgi:hypothetical protein
MSRLKLERVEVPKNEKGLSEVRERAREVDVAPRDSLGRNLEGSEGSQNLLSESTKLRLDEIKPSIGINKI